MLQIKCLSKCLIFRNLPCSEKFLVTRLVIHSNFDFSNFEISQKWSYHTNLTMQSIKTYRNKHIDKIRERERDKDRTAIYKGIPQISWHWKVWGAEKQRSGKKKIGKRKEGKRDSWSIINGPKSRIHQYTIISIQTQTNKVLLFFKKDR